ncbi:hypothetical protein CHCC20331_1023 [Bacillus paralicheniformis]|nr:hypothetical protein CHCC20331_1023 [Bacillus paralicheniformis]
MQSLEQNTHLPRAGSKRRNTTTAQSGLFFVLEKAFFGHT